MKRSVYYGSFGGIDKYAKKPQYAVETDGFAIDAGGSLYKCPGRETSVRAPGNIVACWAGVLAGRKAFVFLAGGSFCDHDPDSGATIVTPLSGAHRAAFFKYESKLYMLSDAGYFRYDGSVLESVEGYVPLISVSTSPSGAGTAYEAVNMLTPARRQLFSPDGTETCFRLAEKDLRSIDKVVFNGEVCDSIDYMADTVNGTVTMATAPAEGIDTLEITYSAAVSGRDEFLGYRNAILFGSDADERVFLWNNAEKPCMRIHSELADGVPSAEYFPVNNYTCVGSAPITDMVQEYDKQLIFTTDSAYYSYCEMKTAPSGKAFASFPVYPLHPRKGNLVYGSSCSINGLAATLCRDGVNVWRPSSVETEKNAVCISAPVNDSILPETGGISARAKLFEIPSRSELWVICGGLAAIFNYAAEKWYLISVPGVSKVFEAFGDVYTVEGEYIKRFTQTVRAHVAHYKTHYSDLGCSSLKDIRCVDLTLQAGYVTAGSVKLCWPGESGPLSAEKSFTVDPAHHGNALTVNVPFCIPHISGLSVEFKCPAGKELKILGYGISYDDKGVNNGL